jgi:DNA-binding NarL/FixJ family response regulator
MTSIVILDDHKIVRQGVHALLSSEPGFNVVGEAGDGPMALELIGRLKPDILVTDLMMKGMSGLEVIRETVKACPETKSLVLSMYGDEVWVLGALEAGAKGYVIKESSADDLIQAIHTVVSGQVFLSPPLSLAKIQEFKNKIK